MKYSQLKKLIKEEIRSTLNEGLGDKVLDKIFDFFKHDLFDDLKLSHGQALKLTNSIEDLIEDLIDKKKPLTEDKGNELANKVIMNFRKALRNLNDDEVYSFREKIAMAIDANLK